MDFSRSMLNGMAGGVVGFAIGRIWQDEARLPKRTAFFLIGIISIALWASIITFVVYLF